MEEIRDYLKIAFQNLKTRSLRSWLTILGIVIGVFLIVSLLSLSEGLKTTINKQLKAMGGEIIIVMPGDESNPFASMMVGGVELEREDISAIQKTEGVDKVITMSYSSAISRYNGEGKTTFLGGLSLRDGQEILSRFEGWTIGEGRWPIFGKNEVIVGKKLAEDIFEDNIIVNSDIMIKGRKMKVVGILESLGSKTDDSFVYMDMDIYENITGKKKGSAQMAMVKVSDGVLINDIADKIKLALEKTTKRRGGTDAASFAVITAEKVSGIANDILSVVQAVIVGFASIAIIVGGIGIMNTMLTSVRERTKEIGIMKAIGAKNSAITSIFLMEAAIIGFVGGIGGTALGTIMAKLIEVYGQVHPMFYFSAVISPGLVLFGLIFSLVVGCLAGFLPARRAAKLRPVDALRRYE